MKTYFEFLKYEFKYALRYRANTFFSALTQVVGFFVFFFLWKTIFAIKGTGWNYTFREMATYYLLVTFFHNNVTVCWSEFSYHVRSGFMVNFLSKPLDIYPLYYFRSFGALLPYMAASGTVLFVTATFLHDYISFPYNFRPYLLALLFWIPAGFIRYSITFMIEVLSFWLNDVSGFSSVYYYIEGFLVGSYIPLDIIGLKYITGFLPFKFVAFFPARIILGKVTPDEIVKNLILLIFWLVIVILFSKWLKNRGISVYEAPGI